MANEEVEGLHVYAPAYYLGHLASLDPHEVIVVGLEDELLAAQKVIVALYSMIASEPSFSIVDQPCAVLENFFDVMLIGRSAPSLGRTWRSMAPQAMSEASTRRIHVQSYSG